MISIKVGKSSSRSLKNTEVHNDTIIEYNWVMKGEEIIVLFLLMVGNKKEIHNLKSTT